MCLLCFCKRLFIVALWSPAGKGLTSWLSLVMPYCEFDTFPLVSLVRFGTLWYRYLIFALFLTLILVCIQTFPIRVAKALASLRICADSPEPQLLANAHEKFQFFVCWLSYGNELTDLTPDQAMGFLD